MLHKHRQRKRVFLKKKLQLESLFQTNDNDSSINHFAVVSSPILENIADTESVLSTSVSLGQNWRIRRLKQE